MMKFRQTAVLSACAFALAACADRPTGITSADDAAFDVTANAVTTTVVSPAAMNNWFFYDDNADVINNALGSFVTGPGTPPFGIGSAQITTIGGARPNLATYQFAGTPLASITELKFSTYNASATNNSGPDASGYLHFNVDFDGSNTWQRRLVFVPSVNGTVTANNWNSWDAINGGNALWSYSGPTTWPGSLVPAGTAKTWSAILAEYPGVRIRATDAFVGIRVGEPYASGYTENIDSFTFGTAAGTTVFDFEPYPRAANADQCMKGGWQGVTRADGTTFANQGDCVSYVKNGK
jgi:hypothetical protein